MITCPKCSKEDNQDHYKFCLGCGAALPSDAAPKPFSAQTPPHGMKAQATGVALNVGAVAAARGLTGTVAIAPPTAGPSQAAQRAGSPATAATAPVAPSPVPPAPAAPPAPVMGAPIPCPQCGHVNGPATLFCGSCGFRLGGGLPRPAAAAANPSPGGAAGAIALTALRADGSEAGVFALPSGGGTVGRETGGIFAGDSYLSPRHATFRVAGPGKASVRDEGSLNGVYKKLTRDVAVELRPNDVFRIGQEIIRYEPLVGQAPSPDGVERFGAPRKGYIGRIALVVGREETGNAFPVPEGGIHLGRERGDLLFPEDGYVSGLHCHLSWDGKRLFLTDLGSSNGTFLRVLESDLRSGDVLLMGQQLFRVGI